MRQENMSNREYAEHLATMMRCPDSVRESVIKDLVDRLASRQLLNQIESNMMKVVIPPDKKYGPYGYSVY